MDIQVFSARGDIDFTVGKKKDISFTVIREESAAVISPKGSESTVSTEGGFTSTSVAISGEGDLYGPPYFTAKGGIYIYYSWAEIAGSGWLARRVECTSPFTQSEIKSVDGTQPETLAQFQALDWDV